MTRVREITPGKFEFETIPDVECGIECKRDCTGFCKNTEKYYKSLTKK